jgi:hypothetical protein
VEEHMGNQITITIPYREKRKKKEEIFEINITPNIFNLEYPLFMAKNEKIMNLHSRYGEAKTLEALEEIEDEIGDMNMETVLDDKYKLVGYILKANGYDFNKELWHELADPADVNNFIISCATKDIDLYPKKKVVAQGN